MTSDEKKVLQALRAVIGQRAAARRVPECATRMEVYLELAEDATTACVTAAECIGAMHEAWPEHKLSDALEGLESAGLILSRPAQNHTTYYLTDKAKEKGE